MASNRADKYTATNKITELFSDFTANLTPHPGNKQLVRYTNEESVKSSIKNLLKTNRYSRFFNPDMGSNIRKTLFKNITPQNASDLQNGIEETIRNYEKRASLTEVSVVSLKEQNAYHVTVLFYIINKTDPIVLTQILYKVR
jgi:phage baseplate assembly protein W